MLVALSILSSCRSHYQNDIEPTKSDVEATRFNVCPVLPSTFKENDLIGIWIVQYSLNDQDMLILNEDGTYKQIYNDPEANQRYESDWQEWWIEYRDSGYVRLHLKGMHRAGETEAVFNREGGGLDSELFTAIDYCENNVIKMPDEIVLIVTGSNEETPRGVILRQTRLAGSEWTWSFHLQE